MTNTECTPAESSHKSDLKLLAARRTSAWFGYFFAIAAAALGLLAIAQVVYGIQASHGLPDTPRPGVGPGFSQAATQLFGSLIVSACLAFASLISLGVAFLHSASRRRTSLFAIPIALYVLLVVVTMRWGIP
jgi:hypothetical protein